MKTQHTPGPWYAGKNGFVVNWVGDIITRMEGSAYGEHKHANTLLIAASPELLAALKTLQQGPPDGDNTDDWFEQYAINLEGARAAIAKAEGTQ